MFQRGVIRELRRLFPGCVILKNDPNFLQGIPDLLMLWKKQWAALECKTSFSAKSSPNQDYYIQLLNRMSFASFIYPGNREQVLHDLQLALGSDRPARVSRT
jgi:hypothetical protein